MQKWEPLTCTNVFEKSVFCQYDTSAFWIEAAFFLFFFQVSAHSSFVFKFTVEISGFWINVPSFQMGDKEKYS